MTAGNRRLTPGGNVVRAAADRGLSAGCRVAKPCNKRITPPGDIGIPDSWGILAAGHVGAPTYDLAKARPAVVKADDEIV